MVNGNRNCPHDLEKFEILLNKLPARKVALQTEAGFLAGISHDHGTCKVVKKICLGTFEEVRVETVS